jgi:hypothetical protein
MNKFLQILVASLTSSQVHAGEQEWKFVQAIGGISIGVPIRSETGWLLPVRADVSGFTQITTKPTLLNSSLICERSLVSVERTNIYITLVTGLVRSPYTAACPSATLGRIASGNYRVYYRGPDEQPEYLGEAQLEP